MTHNKNKPPQETQKKRTINICTCVRCEWNWKSKFLLDKLYVRWKYLSRSVWCVVLCLYVLKHGHTIHKINKRTTKTLLFFLDVFSSLSFCSSLVCMCVCVIFFPILVYYSAEFSAVTNDQQKINTLYSGKRNSQLVLVVCCDWFQHKTLFGRSVPIHNGSAALFALFAT